MEKLQLSLLFKIIGVGAASGLVYHDNSLYIISDSSTYLYHYTITNQTLNKIALVENPQENIKKKSKPDFESITHKGDHLYLIGSGATDNRTKTISYHLKNKKIKQKDLSVLYQKIKTQLAITDQELNIEGIINHQDKIMFFQRGNGQKSKNGIITVNDEIDNPIIEFLPITLPKIKHIEATFTDAILVDSTIYFLASAEDTTSTYTDGEVLGSIIGSINIETMTVNFTQKITNTKKLEGITLYKKTNDQLQFLLCEDNDTTELVSNIYLVKMERK